MVVTDTSGWEPVDEPGVPAQPEAAAPVTNDTNWSPLAEWEDRTDDDLINDALFVPEKEMAKFWIENRAYDQATFDRMLRIRKEKDARGLTSEAIRQVLRAGVSGMPGMFGSALKGAGQLGANLYAALPGSTDEEKARAAQTLLASIELGGVESGGLLMNAVPIVGGVAEAAATAATGGSALEATQRGVGETLRRGMRVASFMNSLLRGPAERFVQAGIEKLDPRDPAEEFINRMGRYYEYDRARSGQGVVTEALGGLNEEELQQIGVKLDPEEIDNVSIFTDISNAIPVGAGAKGFKLVNTRTGRTIAQAADAAALEAAKSRIGRAISAAGRGTVEAVGRAGRAAVAAPLEKAGKEIAGLGKFMGSKVAGIAMATGLTAAVMSGNPASLLIGTALALGSRGVKAMGEKMAKSGAKFARGEGGLEWIRRRIATGSRGVVHGTAGAVPLALLADDPEMAAGIISSGALGAYGALGSEAFQYGRDSALTGLHQAWKQADVQGVPSAPYAETGERATDIKNLNAGHEAAVRRMATNPVGQKAAALIARMREHYRRVQDPNTGRSVETKIWLMPRDAFQNRFGADAHGYFAGTAPDGSYEIYLSEDTTGMHHELGHLMHALTTPEQSIQLQRDIEKAYGPDKIEAFRSLYERMLNANLPEGATPVSISREQALGEIAAEHFSLVSRGSRLDGLPPGVVQPIAGLVGRFFQAVIPGFRPEVAEMASAVPGTLPIEPSFRVLQTAGTMAPSPAATPPPLPAAAAAPTPPPLPPTPSSPPSGPAQPPPLPPTGGPTAPAPIPAPGETPTPAGAPLSQVTPTVTPPAPITPRAMTVPGVQTPPVAAGEEPENLRGGMGAGEFARTAARDVRDLNDVEKILQAVEQNPDIDQAQVENLRRIAGAIRTLGMDRGGPLVSLFYQSVKPSAGKDALRRWQRRNDQAEAYYREQLSADPNIKESTRAIFQKNTIPYRFRMLRSTQPGGAPRIQVLGLSPDKVLGNATILLNDLMASDKPGVRQIADLIPAAWEYIQTPEGLRFTTDGLNAMASDLAAYSQNHANGFTGQGQPIRVPEGYQRYVPQPTPGFSPNQLPATTATMLNLLMGIAPPTTTKRQPAGVNPVTGERITIPGNVEAQILATENNLTPVPAEGIRFSKAEAKARGLPSVVPQVGGPRPQFVVPELGNQRFDIMEMNPIRTELSRQGYNAKDNLTEAIEALNLEDIVTPPEGIGVRETPIREISTPLATAGFLPRADAIQRLRDVATMTPEQFAALAKGPGGLTGQAYAVGISLAGDTEMGIPLANALRDQVNRQFEADMAAGRMDQALAVMMKGQFFREAREVMEDSGSMAGFSTQIGLLDPSLLMIHKNAVQLIDKIRSGEEFGGTLNADGTLFDPARLREVDPDNPGVTRQEPTDVVTLASVNVPANELTVERVRSALQPYTDALSNYRVKPGLFKIEAKGPRGEAMVSIDVNAVVNQKHRANSVAFAQRNNQQAIWDSVASDVVPTGGSGETVLTDPAQMRAAADALVNGRMPTFPAQGAALPRYRSRYFRGREFPGPRPAVGQINMAKSGASWFMRQMRRSAGEPETLPVPAPETTPPPAVEKPVTEWAKEQGADDATVEKLRPYDEDRTAFLPADRTDVETIKMAAIRSRLDGRVWTGPMHFAALMTAIKENNWGPQDILRHFPDTYVDNGFVTSTGRYVTRTEAFEIAERANQLKADATNSQEMQSLQSEDVAQEGMGPEGLNFLPRKRSDALPDADVFPTQGDVMSDPAGGGYRVRTKDAPEKTVKAYKLFRVRDGKLYPLFVGATDPLPRGLWLDATAGPSAEGGKVRSKLGPLKFRPGWHAGDLPLATHIGIKKDGKVWARRPNEVWAEVELAADVDYQPEANAAGVNARGVFSPTRADLAKIPEDGYYRYKTNPNMTGDWMIGGSMKINRVLPEAEVNRILKEQAQPTMPWTTPEGTAEAPLDLAAIGVERMTQPATQPAFAPRRKKDLDFAGLKGDRAGWILPDGSVKKVTSGLHENDLAENSADYNKRFGTKFTDRPDVAEREKALKAGFVRIRYEPNQGRLHIEIPDSKWPAVRGKVEGIFLDNEDWVDNAQVSLVDTKPKTPKVLDFMRANLSQEDNKFQVFSDSLDNLRKRGMGGLFLPKNASIAAKRRAAKEEIEAAAKQFPESMPVQFSRDENNVPQQDEKGNLVYAKLPYQITDSVVGNEVANSLPKDLGAREAAMEVRTQVSKVLGERLAEEGRKMMENPRVALARKWYRLAAKLGKSIFGEDMVMFAQLLAATSPRTGVRENFLMALDAYNRFKKGDYKDIVNRINEGWEKFEAKDPEIMTAFYNDVKSGSQKEGGDLQRSFLSWLINREGLKPRKSNGKLFGANSTSVALVLGDAWDDGSGGKKTKQFTGNLTGADWGPTIDVWAARIAHRLLNRGKEQWRILARNETGVDDVAYDVIADGFRQAAKDLGMEPADLQAIVWFGEKKLWDQSGWTEKTGAKLASFVEFMEALRRTPEGELVIQPEPGKDLAGLDLTEEQAEGFTVPPSIARAPVEAFGLKSLVEANLENKLRRLGELEGQVELNLQ